MNHRQPPWISPPAIVQRHEVAAVRQLDMVKVEAAIRESVLHAIEVVGIEGVRRMSMFPSASRQVAANGPLPSEES